jgi:hypothetical protein
MPSTSYPGVALPLGAQFVEPDAEIAEHRLIWKFGVWHAPPLPAEMIRITGGFREPPFLFEESSQRHEAPATQVGEIRWSAAFMQPVVYGAPPALPHPRTPLETQAMLSALKSMAENLQDFPAQMEAVCNSEYAQLLRQHYPPLAVAQRLETKDAHEEKVSP